jgi:hypothetical protein
MQLTRSNSVWVEFRVSTFSLQNKVLLSANVLLLQASRSNLSLDRMIRIISDANNDRYILARLTMVKKDLLLHLLHTYLPID